MNHDENAIFRLENFDKIIGKTLYQAIILILSNVRQSRRLEKINFEWRTFCLEYPVVVPAELQILLVLLANLYV